MNTKVFFNIEGTRRQVIYRNGQYWFRVSRDKFAPAYGLTAYQRRKVRLAMGIESPGHVIVDGRSLAAYWDAINEYIVVERESGVFTPWLGASEWHIVRFRNAYERRLARAHR